MPILARLRSLGRNLFLRDRVERELADEVHAFFDAIVAEKVGAGVPRDEARRQARIELGGVEQVKEQVRDVRHGAGFETVWQDVRVGARSLRNESRFTVAAVLTLALGIGASTSIFAVVDAVLLSPLPYREPGQLVAIWESRADEPANHWRMTPADFVDLQARATRTLEGIAAFGASSGVLTGEGEPVQLLGVRATESYFRVLGMEPLAGRVFTSDEAARGDPVMVISSELWRGRFGGAVDVVGRAVRLDGTLYTIVGVMPPGLYPAWPATTGFLRFDPSYHDYWIPRPTSLRADDRRSHVLGVIGRRRGGVTESQAQAELDRIAAELGGHQRRSGRRPARSRCHRVGRPRAGPGSARRGHVAGESRRAPPVRGRPPDGKLP